MMASQAERRAATRAALMSAARTHFGEGGFESISINQLASAAQVTRGAVYHHFASKEALFEAVFHQVEAELQQVVADAVGIDLPAREALSSGCKAYVRFARKPRIARIALIDAPAVLGRSIYKAIDESYFLPSLNDAIRTLRPGDSPKTTELLSRAIFAAVCELALQATQPGHKLSESQTVIDLLVSAV